MSKKHPSYWRIQVRNELVNSQYYSGKFHSEKDAIAKAKEISGDAWKERTTFYEYYWVEPTEGYYSEEVYKF